MTITKHLLSNDWYEPHPLDRHFIGDLAHTSWHGHSNGYVGVPPGHPWFKRHFRTISCKVHGGLSYSEDHLPMQKPDGNWYVGFDTVHGGDNPQDQDETYCKQQLDWLHEQASDCTAESVIDVEVVKEPKQLKE